MLHSMYNLYFSLRSNRHRHPAPSANVSPAVQSPAVKLGGFGRKEVREGLAQVCFIGEGFHTKMIIQGVEEAVIGWRKVR